MAICDPLVSVIIPMYNSEKFVEDTVKSALAQTWPSIEIIIIDDGSIDQSVEIVKRFDPSLNIQLIVQENSGACAARNAGFRASRGEYIQYLDADDLLSPTKISEQMDVLLSDGNMGTITSCQWGKFSIQPSNTVFIKQQVWRDAYPVDWLVAAWNGGGMMQTACWLTPRKIIELAGPWNELLRRNPSDDGEFFCRVILKSQQIRFVEPARVYYREHNGFRVSTVQSLDAVTSLLGNCMSYEDNIFEVEKSDRTTKAVATNYASFVYQYTDIFPKLTEIAKKRLFELGYKNIKVGGSKFKLLSSLVGFNRALNLRSLARKITHSIESR